jgi:uncharacterized membrane protein
MESITILTSLLFVWLKARIDFEENFIKIKNPNSILGFIPLGSKKFSVAINQIASVDSEFKLLFKNLIVGIIELSIALALFKDSSTLIAGIIVLLFGVSTVINSFQIHMNINTTSGQTYYISAFIFQKGKLANIESSLNNLISNRMDDTNNRKVAEVQTEALKADNAANTAAIVNAIKDSK